MDANEYALKVQPPPKSLGLLIRKAIWLGKGQAPARSSSTTTSEPAAKETKAEPPTHPEASTPEPPTPLPSLAATAAPAADLPVDQAQPEIDGDVLRLTYGSRVWQVRGLPKTHPGASLKLNVRVQQGSTDAEHRAVPALHVDSVDLYSARSRAVFAVQAAAELGGHSISNGAEALQRELGRELGRVLLAVEQAIAQREREANAPKQIVPTMTEAEHAAALAWLREPNLLARIAADFDACGLVGEATNKLTAYLACVSRLLANPLAVLVQSCAAIRTAFSARSTARIAASTSTSTPATTRIDSPIRTEWRRLAHLVLDVKWLSSARRIRRRPRPARRAEVQAPQRQSSKRLRRSVKLQRL